MARINFEDRIYRDPRFIELIIKEKSDRFRAIGICVAMWDLAQRWFLLSPHGTVPENEWQKALIPDSVFEVGLARKTDTGIYVCGSNDEFKWLVNAQEAGKRGGKGRPRNDSGFSLGYPNEPQGRLTSSSSSSSKKNKTHTSNKDKSGNLDLVDLWNQECGSLPRVERMTKKRETAARLRLAECPDLAYWKQVVQKIAASKFCNGDGPRAWRASFDFLLRPDTHVKVMEGQYDENTQANRTVDLRDFGIG